MSNNQPLRGGHAPGHLREAFSAVVEDDSEAFDNAFHDEPMSYQTLLGSLSECTDVMPKELCEQLQLPQGSTYSMGVGAYIALNGMPEG